MESAPDVRSGLAVVLRALAVGVVAGALLGASTPVAWSVLAIVTGEDRLLEALTQLSTADLTYLVFGSAYGGVIGAVVAVPIALVWLCAVGCFRSRALARVGGAIAAGFVTSVVGVLFGLGLQGFVLVCAALAALVAYASIPRIGYARLRRASTQETGPDHKKLPG